MFLVIDKTQEHARTRKLSRTLETQCTNDIFASTIVDASNHHFIFGFNFNFKIEQVLVIMSRLLSACKNLEHITGMN